MRSHIIVALLAASLASPALAEEPKIIGIEPAVAPKTYTLTVTEQELNVIGAGISQLPLGQALGTFSTVNRQVDEQRKRAQDAKPGDAK